MEQANGENEEQLLDERVIFFRENIEPAVAAVSFAPAERALGGSDCESRKWSRSTARHCSAFLAACLMLTTIRASFP